MYRRLSNAHFYATVVLGALLYPSLRFTGLSVLPSFLDIAKDYALGLCSLSSIVALIFAVIAFPREVIAPLTEMGPRHPAPWRTFLAVLVPAAYFLVGFTIMLFYNDVIAAIRFDGAGDVLLTRIDSALLGGFTVSNIINTTGRIWPGAFKVAAWIYVALFPQIGAGIVLLGLKRGLREALRLVATILTAYYLSLFIFFLIPAVGPFFLDRSTFSRAPAILGYQQFLVARLHSFENHGVTSVSGDFFIGFPSMHIAQPVILVWALRRWKRLRSILVVYDLLLIPAIVILGQHYIIDLPVGIAVALTSIALNPQRVTYSTPVVFEDRDLLLSPECSGPPTPGHLG